MKKAIYHEMLRRDIWQFVSRSSCKTLEDRIEQAREREIDMEMERKWKPYEVQISGGSGKRPKVSNSRLKGHQGHSRCGKCDRTHEGSCRSGSGGGSGCFKWGRTGHYSMDYTTTTIQESYLICFHYNQRGHKKVQCTSLAAAGPVSAPAPATLRITDGHQA